jgi:hypothetical protein
MIAAPTNLRELVRLFAQYQPEAGLDALFASVDWTGVSPRQLAHAFFGRPPHDAEEAAGDPAAVARRIFESGTFRRDLLRRVIAAFPSRQRILFVHLPKCAGTDFEDAMKRVHPSLYQALDHGDAGPDNLARQLHAFARQLPKTDTVFVGGHVPLRWYIDNEMYRFTDRLVTIVRHPREIAISFANYVVMCMRGDPRFVTFDCRMWGSAVGIDHFDLEWSEAEVKKLVRRISATRGMMPPNPMCDLLGDGTAAGTFGNLARVDIEITHVANYTAWLRKRWGIERIFRANAAPRVIGAGDLTMGEKGAIAESFSEDMKLYSRVIAAIEASGELSVMGPQVVG